MKTYAPGPKLIIAGHGNIETVILAENVFCPIQLVSQVDQWIGFLSFLQKKMKSRLLVSSIISGLNGITRSGLSHPNNYAIDVTFPDAFVRGRNPHFDLQLDLATFLARFDWPNVMIAIESDHLHIELTPTLMGVFLYPTTKPATYASDRSGQPELAWTNRLWKVTPKSIVALESSDEVITKQRRLTETKMTSQKASKLLASYI